MSLYRVTMKISFMVDVTPENQEADPRLPLQGDTPEAAINRASWVWLKGIGLAQKTRKALGWAGLSDGSQIRKPFVSSQPRM